jgi:hypothetical protein
MMSELTSSPLSGRDDGLRSPFQFPEDYNLTNLDTFELQIPTHTYESVSYAAPAAPLYGDVLNDNLCDNPREMINVIGGSGVYHGIQAFGAIHEYKINHMGDQQAILNFPTNGGLHFDNPALSIDQAFGLHYLSPSLALNNRTPYATPAETTENNTLDQTFANTTPAEPSEDTILDHTFHSTTPSPTSEEPDWLLAEPVPNLAHYGTR